MAATSTSTSTNNTMVIASFANGEALERRALDANGSFVVDQWPYSQALGQQWRLVPQSDGSSFLMNLASGKALLATGAGDAMQEADLSTGGGALHWQVTYQTGGRVAVLKHVQTGLCLEVASNTAAVGATVHVATCDNSGTQWWVIQPLSNTAASQLAFQLQDDVSGDLLRVTGGGNLALAPSDGARNEQWQLTNHDDGTMSVTNLASGQTLQGFSGVDSMSAPAQAPAAAGQTWRLSGASSNQFAFMSANDGTCMTSAGTGVSQGPCSAQGGWTVKVTSAGTGVDGSVVLQTSGVNPNLVQPWDTGGPIIDDILQGTTDDCWLLAALSTVVWTDPSFITRHISANADGTYTVTIYDGNGHPWSHTTGFVAANLPYPPNPTVTLANQRTGSDGRPIFWPSLYEQAFLAYAQANSPNAFQTADSYLDSGRETMGYQYITGANWQAFDYTAPSDANSDFFWTNLSYANDNIPVSVLSQSPGGNSGLFNDGIIGDHFYAVLKTAGTGSSRTVTLRNPWGFRAPNVSDANNLGDGEITMPYANLVTEFFEIQRAESTSGPP